MGEIWGKTRWIALNDTDKNVDSRAVSANQKNIGQKKA